MREPLIKKIEFITAEDLNWEPIILHPCYGGLNSPFGFVPVPTVAPVMIEVCKVVTVKGVDQKDIYVPVKASETFDFAAKFQAFPLTRAVADQLFIRASKPLKFRAQNPSIKPKTADPRQDPVFMKTLGEKLADFEEQSAYLRDKNYSGVDDFGAHKLWILSNYKVENACRPMKDEKARAACLAKDDGAVNYGFYKEKQAGDKSIGVPFLSSYKPKNNLMQDRGGAHDAGHWDYSQLLQANAQKIHEMRAFYAEKIKSNGGKVTDVLSIWTHYVVKIGDEVKQPSDPLETDLERARDLGVPIIETSEPDARL